MHIYKSILCISLHVSVWILQIYTYIYVCMCIYIVIYKAIIVGFLSTLPSLLKGCPPPKNLIYRFLLHWVRPITKLKFLKSWPHIVYNAHQWQLLTPRASTSWRIPTIWNPNIRVEITREDLCNRSLAMILYSPTFKLQNLLHSPKPSPTKCNGYFCFHVAKKMHFVAAPLLSSSEAEMHFVVVFFGAQHS